MKIYLLSLAVGLVVGVIYGLLNVRSPAPPVIALIGLLGILVGEQIVPLAKHLWSREPAAVSLSDSVSACSAMGSRRFVMKEESHHLQKTGIPDATGFAPGTDSGLWQHICRR